jgi:hypothetical protein
MAESRITEREDMAFAGQWPISMFPWQGIRDATIDELLETMFSTESARRLYSYDI